MAFLRSGLGSEATPLVRVGGLYLRPPHMGDYGAWAELRARSRSHLVPWEPQWWRDELSRDAFRRRVRHYQRELREDLGYAFLLFREADDGLLGGLTLSNVRRGVTQAAAVGYWTGQPYAGRGHMTMALSGAMVFAFDELKLHRLEAACMPRNQASIRVLERNGFQREGLARRYLKIDGVWQDHLLYATLADDPRERILPSGGAA
ncbi:MAG: GNAT family N-acetyltransferase [Hyphomicrobiaceae bacterium]|nr:GNAT family N-acetyltransferase [Hyphomicrobiaceae bacterium]